MAGLLRPPRGFLWIGQRGLRSGTSRISRRPSGSIPHDPAATRFEDWPKTQLTPADLKHGQAAGPPDAQGPPRHGPATGTRPGCSIPGQCASSPAKISGSESSWDPAEPSPDANADHFSPTATSPGRVRVRRAVQGWAPCRQGSGPARKCGTGVVYETLQHPQCKRLPAAAATTQLAGKLSKEEFVVRDSRS